MSNIVWTAGRGWHDGPTATVTLDDRGRLITMTAQQVQDARDWIADCAWREDAEELAAMTDAMVECGIARHYAGDVAQFIRDGE